MTEDEWERLLRGDPEAFRRFSEEWSEKLVRFATGIMDGREEDARDLVQEVLADFFCIRLKELQHRRAATSYLWLMVRNRAYRQIKRLRRLVLSEAPEETGEVDVSRTESPERLALDLEDFQERCLLLERVSDALPHLSQRERDALRLRFEEALGYEDVAAGLGFEPSRQSGYRIVNRALKKIRALLGPEDDPPGSGGAPRGRGGPTTLSLTLLALTLAAVLSHP